MRVEKQIDFKLSAQDKTKAVLGSIDQRLGGITKSVGIYSAAVGAAGLAAAAGLAVATSKAMASIDATAKLSDRLGIATESLIGLRHAAELTGAGAETMDKGLRGMNMRLGQAAAGLGEAKKWVDNLGMSAEDLLKKSPDQAFGQIADRISSLGTQAEKTAAAAALFGEEGIRLVNTMELGSEGLRETTQEAEALGMTFSRVDAAKVEAANDAIHRARMAFSGTGRTIAVNLAPYIDYIATGIVNASKESGGFKKEIGEAMEMGISGATNLAYAFTGTSVILGALKYDFLAFQSTLWEGLMALREANLAVRESLPSFMGGPGSESFDEARQILDEQKLIFNQIQLDKEAALASGANALTLHDEIQKKLEAYRVKILETSRAAAIGAVGGEKGSPTALSFDSGGDTKGNGSGRDPFAGYSDQAAGRLDSLRESLYTEEEAIQSSYWTRWGIIQEAQQLGMVSEQEYSSLMVQIGQQRADNLNAIERNRIAGAMGYMSSLTAGAANSSKTMFQVHKAFALAEGVVDLHAAVMGAYKVGAKLGGPPLGAAFGAVAGAAQAASLQSIASANFSGSERTTSLGYGAGSPTSPVVTQPAGSQQRGPAQINLHINGVMIGQAEWVQNELIPEINEALSRGVNLDR